MSAKMLHDPKKVVPASEIRRLTHGSYEHQAERVRGVVEAAFEKPAELLASFDSHAVVVSEDTFWKVAFEEADSGKLVVTTIDSIPVDVRDRKDVGDFLALSSTCPHLGCQVYWESNKSRFFCPCHNGAFDSQGNATEGPPAKAKQQLLRFSLMVENGLLFIQVPTESITSGAQRSPTA